MLLGLPPLIQHRTIGLHGCFDNGDGALITFPDVNNMEDIHCFRMLYTDSGHYLLPTDDPAGQQKDEQTLARILSADFRAISDTLERLADKLEGTAVHSSVRHRSEESRPEYSAMVEEKGSCDLQGTNGPSTDTVGPESILENS